MENTRKIKKAYFQRQLTGTQSAIGLLVLLPLYAIFGSRIATALMKLSMVLFDYRLTRTALSSYLNLVFGIMMLILLVLLLRGYLKDNWKDFMKNKRSIFIKGLMTFVLVYLANYIGTIVVMLMGGASDSANQAGIEQILSRVPVPMILYAVLVGPVVEELMFRGVIFTTLRRRHRKLAYIITALAFGLAHVYASILSGNVSEIVQIFPYFFAGLVFCYSYESSNNIFASIIGHMGNNLVAVLLALFI